MNYFIQHKAHDTTIRQTDIQHTTYPTVHWIFISSTYSLLTKISKHTETRRRMYKLLKLVMACSGNGLLANQRQPRTQTNADLLWNMPSGTNFNEHLVLFYSDLDVLSYRQGGG